MTEIPGKRFSETEEFTIRVPIDSANRLGEGRDNVIDDNFGERMRVLIHIQTYGNRVLWSPIGLFADKIRTQGKVTETGHGSSLGRAACSSLDCRQRRGRQRCIPRSEALTTPGASEYRRGTAIGWPACTPEPSSWFKRTISATKSRGSTLGSMSLATCHREAPG